MSGIKRRNWLEEGAPAWIWPSLITLYSMVERVLGGLEVGKFYEMTTSPSNYMPEILGVVLSGYVGNSWMKRAEARKMEGVKTAGSAQTPAL